ncbi:tripartite motif-containing protein 3-like [Magallana gigas]|uniref:tripartite motif-containing protein 3-like n=1 Tax=Magallana gigas TaxID=29159 RepID=UPI00333E9438
MDPEYSLQDLVRCHLCETITPVPSLYCEFCLIHLCKACVGEHLSDESTEHKVVPIKKRGVLYPKCSKHPTRLCDTYCEQCDIPICFECGSSHEHLYHKQVGILNVLESKKKTIQRDLQELENSIYPKYKGIASKIPIQKSDLKKNSQKLITAISEQGEALHKEIDDAMDKLKSDVEERESKHLIALNRKEKEYERSISEITRNISELKKLLKSNDVSYVSAYRSRNAEFRRIPPNFTISFPRFTPQRIDEDQINKLLGSLSAISIRTEDHGYSVGSSGAESSPPGRPLIDEPRIIKDVNTDYGEDNNLLSVSCLNDDKLWTCGHDSVMRLYNLNGILIESIETKSENMPFDIAVTQKGELVYTDYKDRTVNLVKDTQIQTVIRLRGWKPSYISSTISDDLLVVMISDDNTQTKVVRYSGFSEKHTILSNYKNQPLYSSMNRHTKYITENKNLDICVADNGARAVVVVNQAGNLRFTYTDPRSTSEEPFEPVGIVTDSQSRVLVADLNHRIHILDHNGHLLRYIDKCDLQSPFGLSVDTNDNLFVAESETGKVKKIQYYT